MKTDEGKGKASCFPDHFKDLFGMYNPQLTELSKYFCRVGIYNTQLLELSEYIHREYIKCMAELMLKTTQ